MAIKKRHVNVVLELIKNLIKYLKKYGELIFAKLLLVMVKKMILK